MAGEIQEAELSEEMESVVLLFSNFISRRLFPVFVMSLMTLSAWSAEKTLMIYGDSLSAAYGLDINDGWGYLLEQKLKTSHPQWRVVNLSISGETTAGGLSRFPKSIEQHRPELVLLQLGANDGLRGTSLNSMKNNLEQMIVHAKDKNIEVIMFEMMIPPNYGTAYTQRFTQTFHDLGEEHKVSVVPFFLEGVAGDEKLNQEDGIHPTKQAQPTLLSNIWPHLEVML